MTQAVLPLLAALFQALRGIERVETVLLVTEADVTAVLLLPMRASTLSIVSRRIFADCRSPTRSFCVRANSICSRAPPQPTTVGTAMQTSRRPYLPICRVLTGKIDR